MRRTCGNDEAMCNDVKPEVTFHVCYIYSDIDYVVNA